MGVISANEGDYLFIYSNNILFPQNAFGGETKIDGLCRH